MDTKDWELFSLLKHCGSLSQAAKIMFVTQPALTKRIKILETELGTTLVERNNRGIFLTSAGRVFADYSDEMLGKYRFIKNSISETHETETLQLSVGVPRMMSQFVMPRLLQTFSMQYPNIKLQIRSGFSTDIKQWLRYGDVQIAFVRGNIAGYEHYIISCDPLCIVCKEKISLDNLPELPRITYDTDTQLTEAVRAWWDITFPGKEPKIGMRVGDSQTCVQMILHHSGFGIIPKYIISPEIQDRLWIDPVRYPDGNYMTRPTSLVYRYSQLEDTAIRAFVTFAKDYFPPVDIPVSFSTV